MRGSKPLREHRYISLLFFLVVEVSYIRGKRSSEGCIAPSWMRGGKAPCGMVLRFICHNVICINIYISSDGVFRKLLLVYFG